MATHGRRGFSRFFLGSVAEVVLRESSCPVLTIRAQASDKKNVGDKAKPWLCWPGENRDWSEPTHMNFR